MVDLTETLLAKLAGWEAMKTARGIVAAGRVMSSGWKEPELRGVVQQGNGTIKSGLVIRSASYADNLCPCRDSRDRGLICAHSIAVGIHFLNPPSPVSVPQPDKSQTARNAEAKKPIAPKLKYSAEPDSGEPLSLNLILPPQIADAAMRGRIMVYCEASLSKGVVPVNALPVEQSFQVSLQDKNILDFLGNLNDGMPPAMAQLDSAQFAGLLDLCAEHPSISLGRNQTVEVSSAKLSCAITARLEKTGGIRLKLKGGFSGSVFRGVTNWIFSGATFRQIAIPKGLERLPCGEIFITRKEVPQFFNATWPALIAECEVDADFSAEDFVFSPARPEFKLHLAGGLAVLDATLECHYGAGKSVNMGAGSTDSLWVEQNDSPLHYQTRDIAAEQQAVRQLAQAGFIGPDAKGHYHLKGQEAVLKFFARHLPRLEKQWSVTLEARLEGSARNNLERIQPQFNAMPSGEEWFDLSVAYATPSGERFSQQEIQSLLRSGQSHKRMASGKFALLDTESLDEFNEILVDCQPEQQGGQFRIRNSQAGFLGATLGKMPDAKFTAPPRWREQTLALTGEVKINIPPLGNLEGILRDYQKHGVGWLSFLRENRFGGILADEMGLGKTLQVLALLNSLKGQGTLAGPCLVICPTSLVTNWAAESAKFTPALRTLVLHGAERQSVMSKIGESDLVITSYALIRRDAEFYRGLEFDTVILDEAQHIKNRQSQNAQSVKSIRSRHRLVLTGTPMENSVLDLWSIFDFLMPGYLGNAADFRERYEIPLARERNAAVQDRLGRRIRPFILRRLKRDVAKELPEKIEQVNYCELNEEQRTVYTQILEASRREILADAGKENSGKSRMLMLTALLRLRQVCCDLRLLDKSEDDAKKEKVSAPSGKMELFQELLDELVDGGHRALVFSQFTSMLQLLGEKLKAQSIRYCYLDGSTRDRAEVVAQFQRSSDIPVFLISLKAGGTGLNLTSADTVIHFDPWWNPAVEAQATDRAHRIGQSRVVTSYKLISRGTVEEKILNLQKRKSEITRQVMGGEEAFVASLDWQEIRGLLME